jgi:hypothetical protein
MARPKSGSALAYLMVFTPAPNLFIGGAMVTDNKGLPLEFRYTEPIQPTKIQQVLYGQVLSRYIKNEVILETLLNSLESSFSVLLVNDEAFLEYASDKFAVIRLADTQSPPLSQLGDTTVLSASELLLQVAPANSPVRLTVHPERLIVRGGANDGADMDSTVPTSPVNPLTNHPALQTLTNFGQTMDLKEPLGRIEKALEMICQEATQTRAGDSPAA